MARGNFKVPKAALHYDFSSQRVAHNMLTMLIASCKLTLQLVHMIVNRVNVLRATVVRNNHTM